MLAYYINNIPLLLDGSSSMRLTWYNPACFFDEIPGDVAEGISIPVNETNNAILSHAHRFDNYNTKSTREFPNFEILYGGLLLLSGTLVITETKQDYFVGWCRNNVGNLGKKHRDKFIYDIPAFNQTKSFNNKTNYNPLTDPYGCPTIFNPDFFKDKGQIVELTKKIPNPDYVDLTFWQDLWNVQQPAYLDEPYKTEALTEAFRKSSSFFVNSLNPDNSVNVFGSTALIKRLETDLFINVLSPMLFLNYMLTMLFRDSHFFIDKNAIAEHPDMQKLILYNNFDITHVQFQTQFIYSFYTPTGDPLYDALNLNTFVPETLFSITNISRSYDARFRYRDLIPKMDIKTFILGIQNLLNVCHHFHPDGKVDIIDRETIITSVPIDVSKYLVGSWDMGEKKDVTLKFSFNHDSNDVLFAEHWTDIDDLRDMEKESLTSMTDLDSIVNPEIGEIRYILNNNIYFRYTWISQLQTDPKTGDEVKVDLLGWEILTGGFQNGYFNRNKNEQEEIKTEFSTLFGDQNVMTQQKGNLETMKYAYQNFTPRLLFYLGNNKARFETDNISLDWEKNEKGLLSSRWPKWCRFWCLRQPVAIKAAFPLNIIDYVSRNITNKFLSWEGDFIIETMQTEFHLDSIGDTAIKGYKSGYTPVTISLDEHWNPSNLIIDDMLIDFDENYDLIFDTDFDLFPFGN